MNKCKTCRAFALHHPTMVRKTQERAFLDRALLVLSHVATNLRTADSHSRGAATKMHIYAIKDWMLGLVSVKKSPVLRGRMNSLHFALAVYLLAFFMAGASLLALPASGNPPNQPANTEARRFLHIMSGSETNRMTR